MKVTNVNTKFFLDNLDIVGNAIPSKTPMNVLTGIHMEFNEDYIVLLASDSINAIKKTIYKNDFDFNVVESGSCLVDYKIFRGILSKLKGDLSAFYISGNQFVIECEKSVYRLNLLDINQYPKINFEKPDNHIVIKNNEFQNIINNVSISCSINEKKPILTGVSFQCVDNVLTCYATDSFRLSRYSIPLDVTTKDINFVIPKQSLVVLNKIITKINAENINIFYSNQSDILITIGDLFYKTRLLDGAYPNVSRLINIDNIDKICEVDRNVLYEVIDRINIFKEDVNVCTLNFNEHGVLEVVRSSSYSGEAKEYIDCVCAFNFKLSCSIDYLLDALKTFSCDRININLIGSLNPFTIYNPNNTNLIQLMLPVRID